MEDQLKTMFSKSGTNAAKARLALDPHLFGSEFVDLLKSRENALRGSSASKPTISSKQLTTSGRLSKRWLANSPPELSCPFRAKPRSSRRARRRGSSGSLGEAEQPSLLGSGAPHKGGRRMTARATLTWPLDNIGPSLLNLMATVAGNLFELKQFSGRLKNRPPVFRRRRT